MDIFPYNFSNASLSDKSFIIIIVEENEIAIARYHEAIEVNPSKRAIKYPIETVKSTCPIPVIKAIFPTSLITFGDRCNPTINSKKDIPISEKILRVFPSGRISRKIGPISIPEIIYPMISGCLRMRIIKDTAKTINIMILIWTKISCMIHLFVFV